MFHDKVCNWYNHVNRICDYETRGIDQKKRDFKFEPLHKKYAPKVFLIYFFRKGVKN